MRVSDASYFSQLRNNIGGRQVQLQNAQQRATTGKRVERPSDDPLAASLARREQAHEARAQSFQRAQREAEGWVAQIESALGDVHNGVLSVRDIAVQGATDTLNPEDRRLLADQVVELREHLAQLANSNHQGRHLFSGIDALTASVDAAGVYQGSTTEAQVEILDGVQVSTAIVGSDVFSPAGGVDLFQELDNLETALRADDTDAIAATIDTLTAAAEQVAYVRSETGVDLQKIEMARNVAQQAEDSAVERHSTLVDMDMAEAASKFVQAQTALQAAISVASQLPPPGLASQG